MIRRNKITYEDGVEDRVFSKAKGLLVECLCMGLLEYKDFIIPCDGESDRNCGCRDCKGFFLYWTKCLRFCSNPEQTCMVVCLTLHFEILN